MVQVLVFYLEVFRRRSVPSDNRCATSREDQPGFLLWLMSCKTLDLCFILCISSQYLVLKDLRADHPFYSDSGSFSSGRRVNVCSLYEVHPERLYSCFVMFCSVFLLDACSGKLHVSCIRKWMLGFYRVNLSVPHTAMPLVSSIGMWPIFNAAPSLTAAEKINSNPGGLFVVFNALKMFVGRNSGEAMMYTHDFHGSRFQAQTSLWGQPGRGTDCSGRLCCLYPGRFLRPGWVKPWVTWSDLRLALSWAGGWTWWPPGVLYYLWSY